MHSTTTTPALSPIDELIERVVEVEVHLPPKDRRESPCEKNLSVVLTREMPQNKKSANSKKLVRRNLEKELKTPSTSRGSSFLRSFTENFDSIDHIDQDNNLVRRSSTLMSEDTDVLRGVKSPPGKIGKRYVNGLFEISFLHFEIFRQNTNKSDLAKKISNVASSTKKSNRISERKSKNRTNDENKEITDNYEEKKTKRLMNQSTIKQISVASLLLNGDLVNVSKCLFLYM